MTSKQEAAAAVLMPRTRAVHSFRLKLRWSVRLRRHVHIPANTTAGRHNKRCSRARCAYLSWTLRRPPPHGRPATGAYDKYFCPTPRPEPPEKQRQHARDDTNALPSLGHQDRARVRPDQDRPSGSSAATRTSPTRPRTAMPTHASTTGSKITGTLVGDSSPGQHPKPEYVLDEEVTPRGTSDEKRLFIL